MELVLQHVRSYEQIARRIHGLPEGVSNRSPELPTNPRRRDQELISSIEAPSVRILQPAGCPALRCLDREHRLHIAMEIKLG
jgi:hypothetical protein